MMNSNKTDLTYQELIQRYHDDTRDTVIEDFFKLLLKQEENKRTINIKLGGLLEENEHLKNQVKSLHRQLEIVKNSRSKDNLAGLHNKIDVLTELKVVMDYKKGDRIVDIIKRHNISRGTLYRSLKRREVSLR